MGKSYWFECSKCGYRAKVSGRADRGVNCFVQTIVCFDCKELYDGIIRLKVSAEAPLSKNRTDRNGVKSLSQNRANRRAPAFQSVLNRLPFRATQPFKWLQFNAQCPVSSIHRVQNWNDPGKCPRCGIYLDKNALPYKMWD